MSCVKIDSKDFLRKLQILKRVIGRSDEIFQFVDLHSNEISAWDGCLVFSIKIDADLPAVSFPINLVYSILKFCEEDFEICHDGEILIKCGELNAVFKKYKKKVERVPFGEKVGEIHDYVQGLDYISKPMGEEEMVEVHFGKISVAHAITSNLSVFYVFNGSGRRFSFSMPYQSVRRFSKAAQKLKDWEIFGGKSLGFRSAVMEGSICGEVMEEHIALPRIFNARKLDEKFRKIVKKSASLLGNFETEISIKSGKITITGSRGEMMIAMSDSIDLDLEFRIRVPVRKFSSYLSGMSSVWVDVGGGVVRFVDGKGKRYVITKKAL